MGAGLPLPGPNWSLEGADNMKGPGLPKLGALANGPAPHPPGADSIICWPVLAGPPLFGMLDGNPFPQEPWGAAAPAMVAIIDAICDIIVSMGLKPPEFIMP